MVYLLCGTDALYSGVRTGNTAEQRCRKNRAGNKLPCISVCLLSSHSRRTVVFERMHCRHCPVVGQTVGQEIGDSAIKPLRKGHRI